MRQLAAVAALAFLAGCATPNTEQGAESSPAEETTADNGRLLGAYYFGAGYFTMVPENLRHDLDEMKALGTDVVCIGITESDIKYNKHNINLIIDESHQRGMQVFAVPSRLAGITAGQPIEPPLFGYHHPHTATLRKDGSPVVRTSHGILSSFYHPEVKSYFHNTVGTMLDTFDLDGIIWDEPKSTFIGWQDFSPLALENNPDSSYMTYMEDFAAFMSDLNLALKAKHPETTIVFFDEACRNDTVVQTCATIEGLDYYGTDGHPYPTELSEHTGNRALKVLPVWGERYLQAGRDNGVGTMMLVENQMLTGEQIDHMEKYLPEIMGYDMDFMIYYYYGFWSDDSERRMDVIRDNVPHFKTMDWKPKL